MRLDKYLSNSTDYSRSTIKKLIKQQQVLVNGLVVADPAIKLAEEDHVELAGEAISVPVARYFMLHKPAGVVSATKDSEHPTALDYFDEPRLKELQIAGRLDIDATGLLLITDDGQWNHRVTSPRHHCLKCYYVELADPVSSEQQQLWQQKFHKGLWLENEKRRTLPATIEFADSHCLTLTISEGKYHQVKRMCAAMGNRVELLHRQSIGNIVLDPELAPGEYRLLSTEEIGGLL